MTLPERVQADYEGMDLTTGPASDEIAARAIAGCWRAIDLPKARHGSMIQIAGNVICRQRPGTAKGFVFISLEDETGVANAIVTPDLFERLRLLITEEPFLVIEGEVQNTDNVVLVKARNISPSDAQPTPRQRVARFSVAQASCLWGHRASRPVFLFGWRLDLPAETPGGPTAGTAVLLSDNRNPDRSRPDRTDRWTG